MGICVPFEVFGKNLEELMFSFSSFFPAILTISLLSMLVIFLLLIFLPKKIYRVSMAVFIALGLMLFVQGTYLNAGMRSLGGDNLGEKAVTIGQKIFNLIIWLAVVAGAVVISLLKDKTGLIQTISLFLCGIILFTSFVGPLSLCLTTENIFASKEQRAVANGEGKSYMLTDKGLNEISSSKNVFIFCIDRFDQKFALEGYDKHPEIFDCLEGFTAFDDNISLYGHTFPAVANLLTNKRFDASKSRNEFLNTAYQDNNTLDVLSDNGYKVNLFTQSYYAYSDASYLPEYVSNVSEVKEFKVEQNFRLALTMIKIALYRCFPFVLKNFVGTVNSGTCNNFVVSESIDGYSQYSADLKDVYQSVNGNIKVIDQKLFSFIHVEGCHGVSYDDEWNNASAIERKDVMYSLKNSFKIIGVYLDAMKKSGVYKDATIAITGDHAAPVDDSAKLSKVSLTALYFKPAGVSDAGLKRSTAQVSHDNLWPTIFASENINKDGLERSLFEIGETENVLRSHIWHTYMTPMYEHIYQIKGAGADFKNWENIQSVFYDKFIMD